VEVDFVGNAADLSAEETPNAVLSLLHSRRMLPSV